MDAGFEQGPLINSKQLVHLVTYNEIQKTEE